MTAARNLIVVKTAHTLAWALLASAIVAFPIVGGLGHFTAAAALGAIVLGECVVLAVNGGRCPLTNVAERYTDARTPNFDIYLPRWLALHNKAIFGTLFVAGCVFVLWRWLG